jgi:hypothetical protein
LNYGENSSIIFKEAVNNSFWFFTKGKLIRK